MQVETETTEMSRDSDSSGEGTGRGRRGKETDGGLFFLCIFFVSFLKHGEGNEKL